MTSEPSDTLEHVVLTSPDDLQDHKKALTGPLEPSAEALATLPGLVEDAEQLVREARSPSTRRAYQTDWAAFDVWCSSVGLPSLPATPETVAIYLAHLAKTPPRQRPGAVRRYATISRAVCAIAHAQGRAGVDPPPTSSARVRETLAGLRRTLGVAPAQKAALHVDLLRAMLAGIPSNLLGLRDRAVLLFGFAGGFRRSELVALTIADLEIGPQGARVTIRRSKTDQDGAGRSLGVPLGSGPYTCPVRALTAWLAAAKIQDGPLFRSVSRHGKVGGQLPAAAVAQIVKRYAPPELRGSVAGHSLRAGLVTSAARARKGDRAIRRQTGHKSTAMVDRYVRDAQLFDDNAAEGLL